MGCDYYVYTVFQVVTNDGKTEEIEYSKESHYVGLFYHDDDDETYEQFLNKRMKAEYEEKILFSDGKWLIKNSDLIETYKEYIQSAEQSDIHIQMSDIKKITRIKYAEERM
jgi:hypothetical protein